MNYLQGSFYYSPKERTFQLLQEKARVVQLKELVDTERLQTKTLKLEAKLLKLRIRKVTQHPHLKNLSVLPRLSPDSRRSMSPTPHPRRALSKFS
jgi:hypothetical protein